MVALEARLRVSLSSNDIQISRQPEASGLREKCLDSRFTFERFRMKILTNEATLEDTWS